MLWAAGGPPRRETLHPPTRLVTRCRARVLIIDAANQAPAIQEVHTMQLLSGESRLLQQRHQLQVGLEPELAAERGHQLLEGADDRVLALEMIQDHDGSPLF